MRIWGLRGLILFFRQASARPFSLASHGFKTVVIFKKMIPPCVSVFLMDVRVRWSLYWWLRSRGQVAHMTKVLLSSIMLRRIPLFNWKSVTIWAIFEKRKIKININLAYYESYARPDDDVWWCMLPKKCLLLIRLKSSLPKVCTKRAEVSFWHGFKHLQSRSRGMSVVRRSWFVYSPRETTRLTNHADDFANVNSHASQKKTSAHPR